MLEFKIDQSNPDMELISRAADVISGGGLAVFPTDTVYGLGAVLFDEAAIRRLFDLKRRETGKGLIAMIADPEDIDLVCATVSDAAGALIDRFWPGPLTLVVQAAKSVPRQATVNGTLGVRVPANNLVKALIKAVGRPLATTSANLSGHSTPSTADEARAAMGSVPDILIDGGDCILGIESTVVDAQVKPPALLREGAVSKQEICAALGIE